MLITIRESCGKNLIWTLCTTNCRKILVSKKEGELMILKKMVLLFFIIIFLSSCASYKVIESITQNEDYKIFSMRGNSVLYDSKQLGQYSQLSIGGEILISTRGLENKYFIYWSCLIKNGLNLNKDFPFILIADGVSYELSDIVDYNFNPEKIKMQYSFYYLEYARYRVTKETLQKISNAEEVEYVLQGREKKIEGQFTLENLERFNSFFQNYNK